MTVQLQYRIQRLLDTVEERKWSSWVTLPDDNFSLCLDELTTDIEVRVKPEFVPGWYMLSKHAGTGKGCLMWCDREPWDSSRPDREADWIRAEVQWNN